VTKNTSETDVEINPGALLEQVIALAQQAGQAILDVYDGDQLNVRTKSDESPVTAADLAAHGLLVPGLRGILPAVPVLSEEGTIPAFRERSRWQRYWLVDPLDGTKEFIQRNGEFTVNIALIENHIPVLGVVYVPVTGVVYAGSAGTGAFKEVDGIRASIQVRPLPPPGEVTVVASRRHGAGTVEALLTGLSAQLGPVQAVSMGSSLKLCLVAEGKADFYPRLALTCEWDTAAAQAVVEAAGGAVLDIDFAPMRYNTKEELLNPFFYVVGDQTFDWSTLLSNPPQGLDATD